MLALIGDRAPEPDVLDALDDLKDRALVWGDTELRVAADAGAGLPWHPGQVTLEDASRSAEQIAELIDGLDEPQRELLDRLLEGSPLGRTRDAAPGAPADRPVPQLLAMGLLRRIDADTVILPRHVGQVLRGEEPGPAQLAAPDPVVATTTSADADAAAAGAVIDLLRELDVLLETLGAAPISELRSGGLGVREVRRLAKVTGIDEARLGLILELAAAAGLIASGIPDPQPASGEAPYWAPTVAADRFAEASPADRWHLLANTWLDLPARPALIGTRGPDAKPYAALSDSLYSTAAPLDRRLLLSMLAELPAGAGVDKSTASAALIWRRPRWSKRLQPAPVADLLEEAHQLGLVGRGAISTPGRALVDNGSNDVEAREARAVDAMARCPTRADRSLPGAGRSDRRGSRAARTSSGRRTGGGGHRRVGGRGDGIPRQRTVDPACPGYRQNRRRIALAVRQALQNACAARAYLPDRRRRTPARATADRHGRVVRPMRRPDAARPGSGRPPATPGPACAGADGGDIPGADQRSARGLAETPVSPRPPRTPPAPSSTSRPAGRGCPHLSAVGRTGRCPSPSSETLSAIIAVLRKVTTAPFGSVRVDPAVAMSLLQRAAHQQDTVLIGYVDAAGVATQRVVSPITVAGGQLVAFDSGSGRAREFAIHRITSVVSADD